MTVVNKVAALLNTFSARPFIISALSSPNSPEAVLTFWTGIDCYSPSSKAQLREGLFTKEMSDLWFFGGKEYDKLCEPFAPIIRSATSPKTTDDNDKWESTIDGKAAKIILTDQLARNCFRGTSEAFAYGETSLRLAREVGGYALSEEPENMGEVYGCYAYFCTVALMHSELLADHDIAMKMIEIGREKSPKMGWGYTEKFELEHKAVIERFGRYPHRNKSLGRESTKEELEWLNGPDVPGWAKSQG